MNLNCCLLLLGLLFSCSPNYYREGRTLLKRKSYAEAYAVFDNYVKANPDMPRAYLNRAYTAWLNGNKEQAYRDTEKLLQLDSMNVLALCNRGYMKQQLGRMEQALADYNKALAIDRKSADAYLDRASLWLEQGMRDKAMNDIEKALGYGRFSEHNFGCAAGWHFYFRGVARMKKQDFEGAILYLTNAIKADTSNGRAYYERGIAHKAVNDKKAACADLMKAQQMGIKVESYVMPVNCN
jgi:tetratricopeptide (TPR) repeat protein